MVTKKPAAKKVAPAKTTKPSKPSTPDVEISPPFEITSKWTFKCNDETVTKEVYESVMADHTAWIIEQAKVAAAADMPEKKPKKTKTVKK